MCLENGESFDLQDNTKLAHEVQNTYASRTRKKQPPELFYKSRFSQNFRNIYRKSPVLESLLNKVAGLEVCNFINTSVFL